MDHLRQLWSRLRSSLWLVPTLIVLASTVVAVLLVNGQDWWSLHLAQRFPRLFGAGRDGSRSMLTAVATSMVTVAGVVFSVTVVSLSLASSQYSSRVLRNFMRDWPTQVVLGVFVGIFAFCMVVLRTIHGSEDEKFVPAVAVMAAVAYAFIGLGFLIYFIHHTADSIQASSIISRISDEAASSIEALYPERLGEGTPPTLNHAIDPPGTWTAVEALRSGYVVQIAPGKVLDHARRLGRVLRLPEPGAFIAQGQALIEASGADPLSPEDVRRLRKGVMLDRQRTGEQDAEFGIQQLVDVSVKALSPGINDPTTACMCIDRIGALLALLAGRRMPEPYRTDGNALRVIASAPDFAAYVLHAFRPIIRESGGSIQVLSTLISALAVIRTRIAERQRLAVLGSVLRDIAREADTVEPRIRSALIRRRIRLMQRDLREPPRNADA